MAQPEQHLPSQPIPLHHVAFVAALFVTAAGLIVWIGDGVAPQPISGGLLPFLRTCAEVLWVWFFAQRNRHTMAELRDAVEKRDDGQAVDSESVRALRSINTRLGGDAR